MTNPTPLSPAAQAVLDAYNDAARRVEPDLVVIAAALRAAGSQFFTDWDATRCCVFLDAIADELESQ